MQDYKDLSSYINSKIEDIKKEILSNKISLLDLELNPIFQDLKNSINIYNINKYSELYKETFKLLNQKFEELKRILLSIDNQKNFIKYLKSNPVDSELAQLLTECWIDVFYSDCMSYNFLEYSRDRFCKKNIASTELEHLEKSILTKEFLLEFPKRKFTEKLMIYFELIKNKLPCKFNDIFEDENDQIKIYEHFVYILHLLQLGKIKYHKETESLYL